MVDGRSAPIAVVPRVEYFGDACFGICVESTGLLESGERRLDLDRSIVTRPSQSGRRQRLRIGVVFDPIPVTRSTFDVRFRQ
jgi:hypothetical protein